METTKQFELLGDNELLELTQEQIDWYIKLKKAEAGIRILQLPPTPEYRPIPEKDLTLYQVCGYHFIDRETAQEISNKINEHIKDAMRVDYDYYRSGSDYKYAKPYEGNLTDIEIVTVFKKETYDSIKDVLTSNKKIQDAYEKVKSEYDEQEEKSTETVDKIYEVIAQARERRVQYEEYVQRIQEYLRLANGDSTVAWNFFEKAYTIEPQVKNKILESNEYLNAKANY